MDLHKDFIFEDIICVNFVNLQPDQTEMVKRWRNNEAVRKCMFSDHIISSKEHAGFFKKIKGDNNNSYWLVKKTGENYIGVISLNKIEFKNRHAYLGIYTDPESKMQGAGHILIDCLKKLTFDIANLHTLKLEVIETNERAISFYKQKGFVEEGRLKEFVCKEGKWHDVLVMGIIRKA